MLSACADCVGTKEGKINRCWMVESMHSNWTEAITSVVYTNHW